MDDNWRPLSQFRKVDYRVSGLGYSKEYVMSNHMCSRMHARGMPRVWIYEPVEVALIDDEVMCRYVKQKKWV